EGGSAQADRPHLLIIGWDGATFDMLSPMVAAGRLPNVARLLERGRSAQLESTAIPISSAAWVAGMTGVGPGENGVYGFFEPVPDSYEVRLVDARCNEAPPLWRVLDARDKTVHVFGVPLTWPPEPLNGVMVSGMLSPPDAEYTWPPSLAGQLRGTGFLPDIGVWRNTQLPDRERVEQQLRLKEEALVSLLSTRDWDAAVVVFKSLDVVSHQIYDGRLDGYVAEILERLDGILGKLLEAAGPKTDVLLMSDHGFAAYPYGFDLHQWLVQEGFSVEAAEGPAGEAARRGPLVDLRPQQHRRRIDGLDLAATAAFASECEGHFGSLRLNLAGREPEGSVSAEQREAVLASIEERLRAYAPEGKPLIHEVWRGEELYPGGAHAVPDLIFEVREDHLVTAVEGAALLSRFRAPRPDHDRQGILIAAGPRIAHAADRGQWSIEDITPTALHLMGLSVHEEMSGSVRTELCLDERPVQLVPRSADGDLSAPATGASSSMTNAQSEAMFQSLQSLGYADGVENNGAEDE
ncbi:MAG: putative AlkP superfamily phosphohydrolase/phosphomutase, partial [Planctomycetota bacterium]